MLLHIYEIKRKQVYLVYLIYILNIKIKMIFFLNIHILFHILFYIMSKVYTNKLNVD